MKYDLRHASIVAIIISMLIVVFLIYAIAYDSKDGENIIKNREIRTGDAAVTNIWLYNYSRMENLKNNNIVYLIVDIGGISYDGLAESSFSEIESFVNRIEYFEQRENYDFIILPYSEINTYEINTSSDIFRKNFLMTNKNLIAIGFDGIFLDFEPVRFDQREDFLTLIHETRVALPEDSIIAVYSGSWSYDNNNEWEWNYVFMLSVAQAVDIISFPVYDTGLETDDQYVSHVVNQVKKVNQWYRDYNFWLGIPTHKSSPETSKNALMAYNSVINSTKSTPFIGVAIFSEWVADAQDWEEIKKHRHETWT